MIHGVKLYADPADLLKLANRREQLDAEFCQGIAAEGVKEPIEIVILLAPDGGETWTVEDGVKRILAAIEAGHRYVPITQKVELCQ
jgi:hypothetical protein